MAKKTMYLWQCLKGPGLGPKISKDVGKLKDFLIEKWQPTGYTISFVERGGIIDVRQRWHGWSEHKHIILGYISPVEEL